MAAGDDYLAWQAQQEAIERRRAATKKQAAKPRLQQRQQPSRVPGQSAVIPAQDWVAPIPKHTGISQEPNAPWGVAIHDPLEKQFVTMSPAGFPILRNALPPRMVAPQVGSVAQSTWGDAYTPRTYGGGGGGYGGGGYASTLPAYWWDPGLFNWRYGVTL